MTLLPKGVNLVATAALHAHLQAVLHLLLSPVILVANVIVHGVSRSLRLLPAVLLFAINLHHHILLGGTLSAVVRLAVCATDIGCTSSSRLVGCRSCTARVCDPSQLDRARNSRNLLVGGQTVEELFRRLAVLECDDRRDRCRLDLGEFAQALSSSQQLILTPWKREPVKRGVYSRKGAVVAPRPCQQQ
jgi:hypothetical protein